MDRSLRIGYRSGPRIGLVSMQNSQWHRLDPRMYTAQYRFPGGISRTVIVRMVDDAVVVYSPGHELAAAAHEVIGEGARVFLLIPSRSHMMGVPAWVEQFPDATIVASAGARTRAAKRMPSHTIHRLDPLAEALPSDIKLHVLPGSRFDEVWLSVHGEEATHWLVCDAIMNVTRPQSRVRRALLWVYGIRYGLDTSRLVERGGFEDRRAFRLYAVDLFEQVGRSVLVPCHGEIFDRPDAGTVILAMLRARF